MATINTAAPVRAFLDLIAKSEGTSSNPVSHADGYDVIVSGFDGPNSFADYSQHPFASGRAPILVRPGDVLPPSQQHPPPAGTTVIHVPALQPLYSTASGRYQITLETWKFISQKLSLHTFSPQNQDLAAIGLITDKNAYAHIIQGNIPAAIDACSNTWASFAGNSYGQPTHNVTELLNWYGAALAAITETPTQ